MIVTRSAAYLRMAERMRCSVAASIAAVESSKTMTAGFSIRARAIDGRWRWPPRKRHTALANDGVVAGQQAEHVIVQLRAFAGAGDAAFLRPWVAIGDVVLDRCREQEGILLRVTGGAATEAWPFRTSWPSIVTRPPVTS